MTDKEIKTIRELRMKGWGYGKIARHTETADGSTAAMNAILNIGSERIHH